MLAEVTKGVIIVADSPASGFVNLYADPAKTETYIKKIATGEAVGKLTGVVKMVGQIRFVEVIYDERSLVNWVEDTAFVNASLVTNIQDQKTKAYYITSDNVNIRNSPSSATNDNVIAKGNKGDLIGYSAGEKVGIFTKLLYAKGTGTIYVATQYLTTDKTKIVSSNTQKTDTPVANSTPKVGIITNTDTGEKTLTVLGANIPVSNTNLIVYTVVIAGLVIGYFKFFRHIKIKFF